ncbi:MAG: hypothetical protein JMDDDDMK_04968 [Acidobacteria bacterium]|nr:hypothetical protein [Acidobacteriota bacterium]
MKVSAGKWVNCEGRLLVCYSDAENLAGVMIEGQDETTIRNQAESIAEVIKAQIG